MLRIISDYLGDTTNLSSTAVATLTPTGLGGKVGKFILYNSALPIQTISVAIPSGSAPRRADGQISARGELILDLPLDASGILSLTLGGRVFKPSPNPDDLQPGEFYVTKVTEIETRRQRAAPFGIVDSVKGEFQVEVFKPKIIIKT
ncbi:MAG: hypothetical protein QNJ54_16225 [Prochloraceae cyanobacterium]|nr:hypothetical protein [Prochloraceae cyanobacterium]